ncbi:glycosidase [Anaerotaenia torta]|uniref:alpha-amylase family glycosyl hydrolase n=1 Tax=Anaerotaenia torta TaxID=433293 RepID=UPI003D1907B2
MAKNTKKSLRNKIIYSVYVRNHGKNGKFTDVLEDLPRIKELGTDIIWFLPIHPIGDLNKKGMGCPYSIQDYTGVNPEYGTLEEFKELIDAIHGLDMQVMIDVVYNHTSHDAVYVKEHPEYYYRRDGRFANRIADWSDIIDLDYDNRELWEPQIKALQMWTELGVDGFRCDVAPIVPMEFWKEARQALEKLNPEVILLAETVHPGFIEHVRSRGFSMASDSEVYGVFDICYDYDTHGELLQYFQGKLPLEKVLERKRQQEVIYPENYVKLRYLENHDNPRAAALIPNEGMLRMWTAFMYFEKGAVLIYAGQEAKNRKLPSLFGVDPVDWEGLEEDFVSFLIRLGELKKDEIFAQGVYKIHPMPADQVIYGSYIRDREMLLGIFNVGLKAGEIDLTVENENYTVINEIPDGIYKNIIDGQPVELKGRRLRLRQEPILLRIKL